MLTIAFPKGYLFDEAMSLFNKMGFVFSEDLKQSRKLFTKDKSSQIRILQIRPWDVTEYVEYGAADLGIVGRDVLEEKNNSVAQLMDLHFGKCRLVLACSKKQKKNPFYHNMRVATKYPYLTTKYF